jgi:hypothetical protein
MLISRRVVSGRHAPDPGPPAAWRPLKIPNAHKAERVVRELLTTDRDAVIRVVMSDLGSRQTRHKTRCQHCRVVIPDATLAKRYCTLTCRKRAARERNRECQRIVAALR